MKDLLEEFKQFIDKQYSNLKTDLDEKISALQKENNLLTKEIDIKQKKIDEYASKTKKIDYLLKEIAQKLE